MATATAVRSIFRSSNVRNSSIKFASKNFCAFSPRFLPKFGPSDLRFKSLRSSVAMCLCLDSILPMHNATASAIMISLLSVSIEGNGFISEGGNDDV